MERQHEALLETFDETSLPDLDVVVLAALELFAHEGLPHFSWQGAPREQTLVLGSGNAAAVGQILFDAPGTRYATASDYLAHVAAGDIDRAVIVSASGGKHADDMAAHLAEKGIESWLLTTNAAPRAGASIPDERVVLFPKNREPYTYNTSTYLGMLFSRTGEDAAGIHAHLCAEVAPGLPDNLHQYNAFCLILPARFERLAPMLRTKFDELFGPKVSGRVFTEEEIKHAKTVVPSETEAFVSFGVENSAFGAPDARIAVTLPPQAGYAALMAIGYYVIGRIQAAHPPYFKEHIGTYVATASEIFGESLGVVVE